MRRLLIIFTTAFLLISTAAFAVEMTDLYVAEQRVTSQDVASRDIAAVKGLHTVLLKVVGDRRQVESIPITSLSEIAPSLLEQHQYYDENAAKFAHDNTAPEQLAVRLQFDEAKVNQQILGWGLPVWSKSRPDVLLLIVMDDGDEKRVLTDESAAAKLAMAVARERAIPLLIPLMDLADQQALNMAALWRGDFDATTPFATRYQTPLLVTARMASQQNGQWRIQWQYDAYGEVMHWQSRGDTDQSIRLGMNTLVNNVAEQFSHVKSTDATRFLLEIDEVSGFVAHQKVMAFLSGLTYVRHVQEHALIEGVLTVSLNYFGDEKSLRTVISGGQVLTPLSDIINADRLYYQVKAAYR